MRKIVLISGSFRKNSYNMTVLNYILNSYKEKAEIKILDITKLPFFNEDLEDNLPVEVISFKKYLDSSDGIIISTPEYNYSIPGILKNAIDWASRGEVKILNNKNVAIMSASPSFVGGARAQLELKKILQSLNMKILYKPDTYIPSAYENINNNEIIDNYTKDSINELVDTFLTNI